MGIEKLPFITTLVAGPNKPPGYTDSDDWSRLVVQTKEVRTRHGEDLYVSWLLLRLPRVDLTQEADDVVATCAAEFYSRAPLDQTYAVASVRAPLAQAVSLTRRGVRTRLRDLEQHGALEAYRLFDLVVQRPTFVRDLLGLVTFPYLEHDLMRGDVEVESARFLRVLRDNFRGEEQTILEHECWRQGDPGLRFHLPLLSEQYAEEQRSGATLLEAFRGL